MIDSITIQKILDTANIVEIVSDFVTLHKRGANYVGLCPFHDDKSPSFYVSPSKGICKCFSCGKGGHAIHFLMEHEQISFTQAAEWIAKRYNIPIQVREETERERELHKERESLFVLNQFALDFFSDSLYSTTGTAIGLAYLRQRGFREDIIKRFQLGYSPDNAKVLSELALRKGFKREALIKSGLCYEKEDGTLRDRFWGRIIFPVHSLSGKIVAFGGRVMKSDAKLAKYVNSPESIIYSKSRELYGLYFAKQAITKMDRCFLVEGYADVISMFQAGIENVVASSGTALTKSQIKLIRRFTNNVTVLYDGDRAGIKASIRGIDMLLSEGMNVKVLLLPDGEDPDSFSKGCSSTQFQHYIEEHQVDFIRFKVNLLMEESAKDPILRSNLIKEITQSISVIEDSIVRSVYITECSQVLRVDEQLLINDVNARRREGYKTIPAAPTIDRTSNLNTPVEQNANLEKESITNLNNIDSDEELEGETVLNNREKLQRFVREKRREGYDSIMKKERLLIQHLVRYGEREFCRVEDEDSVISVGEYMINSLKSDSITFVHPVYKEMIDLYESNYRNENFISERLFMSSNIEFISLTAASVIEEPYQLSRRYIDNNDEINLFALTKHLVWEYQYEILTLKIKSELQKMENNTNIEDIRAATEQYNNLLSARNRIAKLLGNRVM